MILQILGNSQHNFNYLKDLHMREFIFKEQYRPKIIVKTFTEFFSEFQSILIVFKRHIRSHQEAFFSYK